MKAAIYASKSTEQSGVADGPEVGRPTSRARTPVRGRQGWIVTDDHVYIDDGISGAECVFFYLEDRERTLDSRTDKIMLSLTALGQARAGTSGTACRDVPP